MTPAIELTGAEVEDFRHAGALVLRGVVDAPALAAELDRALADSDLGGGPASHEDIRFRYVPMMSDRTPISLALIDELAPVAARLLDARVLPLRAKGVRYVASATPHRDSTSIVRSVGLAAYLEPLTAATGALQVQPGSHLDPLGIVDAGALLALETQPGDLIVFDEHVVHGSAGGRDRRQWRVDFFADPGSPEEEDAVRAYIGATFPADWDGGYDVDRFPTYGPSWLTRDRPWHARLSELGAYAAATHH